MKQLYTQAGEKLTGTPWNVYPRPQMRRERWLCLNGEWEFSSEDRPSGAIRVPFCPESLLSGYDGAVRYGEELRYRRSFSVPEDWQGSRILLHFGGVSRACTVFVNGTRVLEHDQAYLPFGGDITDALIPGENRIEVCAVNDLSPQFPYGKQSRKRGGMWYTPVSGIWQTVWLEPVPEEHIARLDIRTDLEGAIVSAEGITSGRVICEGKVYPLENGACRIAPPQPRLWSPETPHLYPFTVESGEDRVESYFALRTVTVEQRKGKPRLCLNGKPYFFHGLLDQGYFSDGLYTPAVPEEYERDILRMKALGFNTLRKHIKIEPEQFYYDCDRLGMVVFQDMVNNGVYRFFRDSALPTAGISLGSDRHWGKAQTRATFLSAMEQTVGLLRSHPCVCYWTIFNEGWGQFDADAVYDRLRALDDSRPIDSTSGWFHQKKTDVDSLHIYFKELHMGKRRQLPQVLSEFGGYVYQIVQHCANPEKSYGYKTFDTREALAEGLRKVYLEKVVPLARVGLCAAIYTQVSDVEDETNGMLTYDRRVCKVHPEELADIARLLQQAAEE